MYYIVLVILLDQENHIIHIYGAKSVVHAYLHSLSNNSQGECIGRPELKLLVGSVGQCSGLHNDRLLSFTWTPLAVIKIAQLKAKKADTLLVWNHASYISGNDCCFEQRVLVKEPLCHCDHSGWSDLIFQLRTATKSELPAMGNDERKEAPGAAYCTSSTRSSGTHFGSFDVLCQTYPRLLGSHVLDVLTSVFRSKWKSQNHGLFIIHMTCTLISIDPQILIPSWVQEKPLTRQRSWQKDTVKSNAKATVLDRIAACPESGNVSNGSVRSIFLTICVQVGSTSWRWLETRKWRKAWRSCLVPALANLCNLSAPMTMIGLIGMSYKDSSGEFRWCECVLDLIHLLIS